MICSCSTIVWLIIWLRQETSGQTCLLCTRQISLPYEIEKTKGLSVQLRKLENTTKAFNTSINSHCLVVSGKIVRFTIFKKLPEIDFHLQLHQDETAIAAGFNTKLPQ